MEAFIILVIALIIWLIIVIISGVFGGIGAIFNGIGAVIHELWKSFTADDYKFLKHNLEEDEKIIINGKFCYSYWLPGIMASFIALFFSMVFWLITYYFVIMENTLQNACVAGTVAFATVALVSILFRIYARIISEFVITTERISIRQLRIDGSVLCRFSWNQLVNAEIKQNAWSSLLGNYSLFITWIDEKNKEHTEKISFLRNAIFIKNELIRIKKEKSSTVS